MPDQLKKEIFLFKFVTRQVFICKQCGKQCIIFQSAASLRWSYSLTLAQEINRFLTKTSKGESTVPVKLFSWKLLTHAFISSSLQTPALASLWGPNAVFSHHRGNELDGLSRLLQEVLRGQQEAPWLRRRGSKNSRKLLHFVEWAQECETSAPCFSRFIIF